MKTQKRHQPNALQYLLFNTVCVVFAASALIPWSASNAAASTIMIVVTFLMTVILLSKIDKKLSVVIFISYLLLQNLAFYVSYNDYDVWQLARSGLPFLMVFPALLCGIFIGSSSRLSSSMILMSRVIIIGCIINIGLYFSGIHIFNSLIAVDNRIFSFPGLFSIPLIYFFIYQRKYIFASMTLIVPVVTGSKALIAAAGLCVIIGIIKVTRKPHKSAIPDYVVGAIIIAMLSVAALILFGDRFSYFIQNGDKVRSNQVSEVLSGILASPMATAFGKSFGVPLLLGYRELGAVGDITNYRLLENSYFELDNGIVELIGKVGLIGLFGVIVIFYSIARSFKARLLIVCIMIPLLLSSGSILFTADGVIFNLMLGFVISHQRRLSLDSTLNRTSNPKIRRAGFVRPAMARHIV